VIEGSVKENRCLIKEKINSNFLPFSFPQFSHQPKNKKENLGTTFWQMEEDQQIVAGCLFPKKKKIPIKNQTQFNSMTTFFRKLFTF